MMDLERLDFGGQLPELGDTPTVPVIPGDGIGPEIWSATRRVLDRAVERAYGDERRITWLEVLAGAEANEQHGEWLPDTTVDAFREHLVGIKGPLQTPVGEGIRSLNVAIRQALDLYASVRPTRWYPNVPSPVRNPERVNVVVFRENTEDVYAGLELPAYSREQRQASEFFHESFGWHLREDAGIGIKPITEHASKRLVRAAVRYAVDNDRRSVTLMHKGNIMKFTEGAFRRWGYEVVREEFSDVAVTWEDCGGEPGDRVLVQDVIADAMLQVVLLAPEDHDIIATTNLNGDYIADALGAQVGGIGLSPGANINVETGHSVFEAVHGTAPDLAGRDVANPSALILSGEMLLRRLGWDEAARVVVRALCSAFDDRLVTADLADQVEGAQRVSTTEFAEGVAGRISSMDLDDAA